MARRARSTAARCEWISQRDAFQRFATYQGAVESARHIKPLHWYVACRLVLEGGFDPDDIVPRPPFRIDEVRNRPLSVRSLSYDENAGGAGERVVLGGLKTKNVDVVVTKNGIGPVIAISCKGAMGAFRNLTNRMEETIGECTNLHITYPAMVIGYFALLRANRTIQDALDAPNPSDLDLESPADEFETDEAEPNSRSPEQIKANDLAILGDGSVAEGIVRFHAALSEMTMRRGIRNEISRYEAMTLALVEPKGPQAGSVYSNFPPPASPLHMDKFFQTLYQRYDERFVIGAPLLAERNITPRLQWLPSSPAFSPDMLSAGKVPQLDFAPRLAAE